MDIVDCFAQGKVEGLISRGLVATVVAGRTKWPQLIPKVSSYDKTQRLSVSALRNLKINISYAVLDAIIIK